MGSSRLTAQYMPFGDTALVVQFGEEISLEANVKVTALSRAIRDSSLEIEEVVPTYRSLLVRYNPMKITYEQMALRIRNTVENFKVSAEEEATSEIRVPIVYGGVYGPDLKFVAEYHGLDEKEVVRLHRSKHYRVFMIGFVAGFPYLGQVPNEIATPRLETPRLKVPAGSVGIAERQTGIYPREAPGGWRIIGRTPLQLFNPTWQRPSLMKAGDIVKFEPIRESEFKHYFLPEKKP